MHTCGVCHQKWAKVSQLKEHMLKHTEGQEATYECDKCVKTFKTGSSLWNHNRKWHPKKDRIKFEVCELAYKTEKALLKHTINTHKSPTLHQCNECEKSYKHLTKHIRRMHSLERPYECDICTKGFVFAHELKAHGAVHVNVKPYSCHICGGQFCFPRSLRDHIASKHENKRPYK